MKKQISLSGTKVRKALTSGIVLGAGISSLLHAQSAGNGKAWMEKNGNRNSAKRIKGDIRAKLQDVLAGNSGNDLLMRSTPGCATTGTAGNDTIQLGGAYCDTAFGLAGEDFFYGYSTSTSDTLVMDGGSGADGAYVYSYGPVILYGGSENDGAQIYTYGSVFADMGDGDDIVVGYAGYGDIIEIGDLGNDTLIARTYYSVYVDAGDGNDVVSALANYGPSVGNAGLNDDFLLVGTYYGDNIMSGGDGNDYMYGVSVIGASNFMDGGSGNDVMAVGIYYTYAYGSSPYTYTGSYLYGGAGDDAMLAHVGNDTLVAGTGIDVMRAYAGDDLLIAVDANMALADGGPGTDLLMADFSLTLSSATLAALERIDIDGTASHTLTVSSPTDVHDVTAGTNALTGTDSTLVVDGAADDNVVLGGSWTMTGSSSIGADDYDIYESPDFAILWINKNLNVVLSGVDAATLDSKLKVGPVPTQGPVNLEMSIPASGTLHLQVRDLAGKALYGEQRFVLEGNYKGSLDLSSFSRGVYLLEVQMGDAKSTRKLVVQ